MPGPVSRTSMHQPGGLSASFVPGAAKRSSRRTATKIRPHSVCRTALLTRLLSTRHSSAASACTQACASLGGRTIRLRPLRMASSRYVLSMRLSSGNSGTLCSTTASSLASKRATSKISSTTSENWFTPLCKRVSKPMLAAASGRAARLSNNAPLSSATACTGWRRS